MRRSQESVFLPLLVRRPGTNARLLYLEIFSRTCHKEGFSQSLRGSMRCARAQRPAIQILQTRYAVRLEAIGLAMKSALFVFLGSP